MPTSPLQKLLAVLKLPFQVLALCSGAKSFVDNPVIGSARLNRLGLHRLRCLAADRMADWRRRRLAGALSAAEREQFASNGYIMVPDFLAAAEFAALLHAATTNPLPALEMRQGRATTRRVLLDTDPRDMVDPVLARVAGNTRLRDLMR